MRLLLSSEKSLMRRVNASTFWRRHGRDISSSSSSRYLFLDFQCPVLLLRCPGVYLEDRSLLFCGACRHCPRSPDLGDFHSGSSLCPSLLLPVDTATALPITDADAPVLFHERSPTVIPFRAFPFGGAVEILRPPTEVSRPVALLDLFFVPLGMRATKVS
ncbi:hypothetical protein Tco_0678387 [Tanacetum coccineum]|uniref:Uncharacterized protein n=1 Tax=Tanacetum coccineum TaxID=301880 RepID=A0ABQ4XEZ5_9ASTR